MGLCKATFGVEGTEPLPLPPRPRPPDVAPDVVVKLERGRQQGARSSARAWAAGQEPAKMAMSIERSYPSEVVLCTASYWGGVT